MPYSELNEICLESKTIILGHHKAHIGGTTMPWSALNERDATGADILPKKIADSVLFAHFVSDTARSEAYQESHWKIHLSIHPYDLAKAWDIICPILLARQVPCFKTTRLAPAQIMLEEMKKVSEDFLSQRNLTLDDKNQAIQDIVRVLHGMQITIYIEEDKEQDYNNLLEQIEPLLYKAGIRPGVIDRSDRAIGIYSSIRHIGPGYTTHEKAARYKSVEVTDPFKPIKTKWHDVQIKWHGLDYPRHLAKVKMTLQQVVDGKSKYEQGIITKREFLQICAVATEFFARWRHLLSKAPDKTTLSSKNWASFNHFKTWVDDSYQLMPLLRENNIKKIKDAENILLQTSQIHEVKEEPLRKLKRQNARIGFIQPKISQANPDPGRMTLPPRDTKHHESTTGILTQLYEYRKETFRKLRTKSEPKLEKLSNKSMGQPEPVYKSPALKITAKTKPTRGNSPGFLEPLMRKLSDGHDCTLAGISVGIIITILLAKFTLGLALIIPPLVGALIGSIYDCHLDQPTDSASTPTVVKKADAITLRHVTSTKKERTLASSMPNLPTMLYNSSAGIRMYEPQEPKIDQGDPHKMPTPLM
ncbi:hypothetical protein OQJ13_08520 [Legionella sp. PATHC035]|uniref:hypothetical protein n=1 Tax=Legionella sp. PATHC035 TaxID=2992040 RepID=UPI002243FF70|nr:hypothetical protein [Legionella sp. PATHC035]MCW8409012.1 hypothetical protein [Legionella sp. PATHC035]